MQHCAEFFATLSAQKCKAICSSSQARIVGDLQYAMKLQCKFQNSISKTPDLGAQSTYEDFLRKTKRRFTRIQCQTFRHQARCKNPALTYLNHRENICRPVKQDSVAVMLGAWCCSKNKKLRQSAQSTKTLFGKHVISKASRCPVEDNLERHGQVTSDNPFFASRQSEEDINTDEI